MVGEYYPAQGVPDQGGLPPDYGFVPPPYQDDASLVDKTNPKEIVGEIAHLLRGEIFNKEKERWEASGDKALLNEKGLRSIMINIRSVVNQNTILSNLNDNEIKKMIITLGDNVTSKLMMQRADFEIDHAELNTVVDLVCNMSYCALKRGFAEGERRFLRTTIQERIGRMGQITPFESKKKGMLDKFKIFK